MEEYGARIVKQTKQYVEKEGLEETVARKRSAKCSDGKNVKSVSHQTSQPSVIEINDDDEFENGIDYGAIDLNVEGQTIDADF